MQLPLAKARGRGAELCARAGGRTSIEFPDGKLANDRHSKTPQGAAVDTGRMRGKGGCRRVMGADRPASRGCLQFKSPSPAGRSPQRGRDGEGVDNAAYEMKFRFFNRLLPSPQPLSHRERGWFAEL